MQAYDFVILFILVVATIWGARRGFAKQLATILSMVLGYLVAVWFREPVAQMIQAPEPWNKFAAMLGLFMVTSLAVWIGFRFVKGEIEDSGLKGFDTQIGALFGLAKGLMLSMVLTMFAAVMLGEAQRHNVLESFSGYNICRLLSRAQAIVPSEWQRVMQPYLEVIDEHQQHLAGEYPIGQPPTGEPYQAPIGNAQQGPFGNSGYAQQPVQPQSQEQRSGFGGLFGGPWELECITEPAVAQPAAVWPAERIISATESKRSVTRSISSNPTRCSPRRPANWAAGATGCPAARPTRSSATPRSVHAAIARSGR